MVGSTDSRIELENTIKTLKTYESIARMNDKPVVAMYYENSVKTPRTSINEQIRFSIVLLSALFSRQNDELDSADLNNWLNYNKVTSYDAHLSYLDFFSKTIDVQKPESLITVASLGNKDDDMNIGHIVDYRCTGYLPDSVVSKISFEKPIHVAVVDGIFTEVHKRLSASLTALDEVKKARITKANILSDKDKPTSNGLIL